jgi:hypothetical protein
VTWFSTAVLHWRGRGLTLGVGASMAYFGGVLWRAFSHDAVLSPTLAALTLPFWAVWAARGHAYAPLAAVPLGACLSLWAYLDLLMVGGNGFDAGEMALAVFFLGVPVGMVVSLLALIASFVADHRDPEKPGRAGVALRGTAWIAICVFSAFLAAAVRWSWGRPTPAQYATSLPAAFQLSRLVEEQPQEHILGRFGIQRWRIDDDQCRLRFALGRGTSLVSPFIEDKPSPFHRTAMVATICDEILVRIDEPHGFAVFEAGGRRFGVLVFDQLRWENSIPPELIGDISGPPRNTFLPPVLGIVTAIILLLRRPQLPGMKGSTLVQGELDDDLGKLFIDGEDAPIPWRDRQVPGGWVVVVIGPVESASGESFRTPARAARAPKVLALLPGKLADLGHAERTGGACAALAVVVLTAAPLVGTVAWWVGQGLPSL